MPERQDDLNPASDLAPFADALRRLAPQPPELSRDALLFEAGKAAVAPRLGPWMWPSVAGSFAALSLVLAAFLIAPASRAAPEIHYVNVPQSVPMEMPQADPGSQRDPAVIARAQRDEDSAETARLLRQRRDVLRWGVDMLPESKPVAKGPSPDVAARELERWLSLPRGTFASPAVPPKKPASKGPDEDE